MSDQFHIPDTEQMETIIIALRHNSDRAAESYKKVIFSEQVEKTLNGLPEQCRDEFAQLAYAWGYQPIRYQQGGINAANDERY